MVAGILGRCVVADGIFSGDTAGFDNADDSERKAAEYGHDDGQGEVGRRARRHGWLLVILRQGSRRCRVWKVGSALRAERRNPAGPAIRNEDNSSSLNMVINIIGSIVRIVFWLSKLKVNHYR